MTTLIALALRGLSDPRLLAGAAFAAVLAFAGLQTARLDHAKADLAAARAGLIDPATRVAWKGEAQSAAADLAIERQNVQRLSASLNAQSAAVDAVKAQGAQDTAKAQASVRLARAQAAPAADAAARTLATAPGPDGCASADKLILDSLGAER